MLARAAGWLTPHGRLIADLDLSAIDLGEGPAAARRPAARLRAAGFTLTSRDPGTYGNLAAGHL